MLRAFLFVAAGGAAGSIARYAVHLMLRNKGLPGLPGATLFVNLLGCFLAGVLLGGISKESARSEIYLAGMMGFWGKKIFTGVLYVGISVVLGIVCCRAGILLAQ